MADRTVKVVLKADVSAYVRDVAVATAATRELRAAAEKFEDRYTATLRVNTKGAVADMKSAERAIGQTTAKLNATLGRTGLNMQRTIAQVKRDMADLASNGATNLFNLDADRIKGEIGNVQSNLAKLSGQKITFSTSADIAEARASLARLTGELRRLDKSTFEPAVKLQTAQLEAGLLKLRRQLADSGPGSLASQVRSQLQSAFSSLPELEIDADSSPAEKRVFALRRALARLSDMRIGVDIDADQALARAAAIRAELAAISGTTTNARVRVDTGNAAGALQTLEKLNRNIGSYGESQRRSIEQALSALPDLEKVSSSAEQSVKTLRTQLRELGEMRDLDPSKMHQRLSVIRTELEGLANVDSRRLRHDIEQATKALKDFAAVEPPKLDQGAFTENLRRQTAAAAKAIPPLELHADSSAVDVEMQNIRRQLVAMSNVSRQNADAAAKRAVELQTRLATISASKNVTSSVRVDSAQAVKALADVERGGIKVETSFKKADAQSRRLNQGLLGMARTAANTVTALKTLSIGPVLAGSVPAVASLTNSVVALGGALATLPALGFAAGAGLAVISIGLKNWGDFVKELAKGKMDKAAVEAAKMAPAAKSAALELIKMSAAYDKAAEAVQESLFTDATREIRELGGVYLPIVATSLSAIAAELNDAGVAFSDFATRADTVRDAKDGLELIRGSAERIAPIMLNLTTIMRDVGAVGARELPAMAAGMEAMTERWAASIADMRADGSLQQYMREGMEELRQLGRIAVDTGGILAGLGRAAEAAGIDTVGSLERATDAAHRWIDSWQGQAQVSSFLGGLRDDVNSFLPGLKDLAAIAYEFIQHMSGSGTLEATGRAFSALAESARPTAQILGQLTSAVLRPMLATVEALAPAIGPVVAGMVSLRLASTGIGKVQTALTNVGGRFDSAARAASNGAVQTSKVSTALGKVGGALPLVGIALLGVAGGYELLRDRSKEAADGVLAGSLTVEEAVAKEVGALTRKKAMSEAVKGLDVGYAQGAAMAADGSNKAAEAAALDAEARHRVFLEMEKAIAVAPPMEAASLRVTQRQAQLNDALKRYTVDSPEVRNAQVALTDAMKAAEIQQIASTAGVDNHTAALIRQRDTMLGAADAEVAWFAAMDKATQSVATNGATLDLNTESGRANKTVLGEMARAAIADRDAKIANGISTDEVAAASKRYQDKLYDTAIQMGMTKEEARLYVGQLALVPAEKETRFMTPGLIEAKIATAELKGLISELPQLTEMRLRVVTEGVNPGDVKWSEGRNSNMNYNSGGGYATGGQITGPGTGTSDDVLMWGSDGEWVIREAVAAAQGQAKMDALNSGKAEIVPKYAKGGRIGRAGLPAYAAGGQVGRGGLPAYAGGGAVGGGGLPGMLAGFRNFRRDLSAVWAGVNEDAGRGFGGLLQTILGRTGEAAASAVGKAEEIRTGVGGQFGQLPGATDLSFGQLAGSVASRMIGANASAVGEAGKLYGGVAGWWQSLFGNTDQQFGATQGTVTNRMTGANIAAVGEAGKLQGGVAGWWQALFGDTDRQFTATRDVASNRMVQGRDNANRSAGETDRGVNAAFGSMAGSAAITFAGLIANGQRKWDELKGAVNGPVSWVVNTAWNKGASALWNAAATIFPIGKFPMAKYAVGGPVYGPGTGTSDSIPAMLSNNEHVWTEKEVQGAGGHGEVARLRAMAGSGQLAQFAQGGAWQSMFGQVKQQFPAARLTSAVRPGDPGYHGRGQAIDIAGPRSMDMPYMLAMNRWIASKMADKTELIHTQPGAVNLKNGRPHSYNAATQAGHRNHVHWATGGGGAQGPGGVFGFAIDMLSSALEGPKNALRAMIQGAFPKNGTLSGDTPTHAGDWIIKNAEDVLRKKAEEMDAAMMAGIGGGGGGGRAGAERWRPLVLQALQMMGQPASLVERVLMQIGTESGGDPRAINNWDINAKRGTPSGGLLQTIQPTYNAYADPRRNLGMFDPLSNILASMRYALSRYGSLTAAYRGVGYADGGTIPGAATGRDDKFVLAQSGERVLTRTQNRDFERLVSVLDKPQPISPFLAAGVRGGDGATTHVEINNENHFVEAVDLDLFNQRQDFAVRSARA